MVLVIAAASAAAIAVWIIIDFNRLVRARNRTREAWAQIDVQLAQRADLVPQLVAAVEGYASHERRALLEVARARTRVVDAGDPDEAGRADDQLEGALTRLYALAEAYPDLKGDASFRDLQLRLSALEDDVASARRYYNALVERYRNLRQTFPTLLLAPLMGFGRIEMFKPGDDGRTVPSAGLRETGT